MCRVGPFTRWAQAGQDGNVAHPLHLNPDLLGIELHAIEDLEKMLFGSRLTMETAVPNHHLNAQRRFLPLLQSSSTLRSGCRKRED